MYAWAVRLTVRQAADRLGISESAVRNRLSRGTLDSEREGGVTYVVLDDIPPTQDATDYRDELIEELRAALAAEREANRENRRLLAAALNARQLESGDRSPDAEEPPESTEGSESYAPARKSWWRRLLGG